MNVYRIYTERTEEDGTIVTSEKWIEALNMISLVRYLEPDLNEEFGEEVVRIQRIGAVVGCAPDIHVPEVDV